MALASFQPKCACGRSPGASTVLGAQGLRLLLDQVLQLAITTELW